jgi:hypothetical protein
MCPPETFEVSEQNVCVKTNTCEGRDITGDGTGPDDFIYTP